jgi:hypothetical protein
MKNLNNFLKKEDWSKRHHDVEFKVKVLKKTNFSQNEIIKICISFFKNYKNIFTQKGLEREFTQLILFFEEHIKYYLCINFENKIIDEIMKSLLEKVNIANEKEVSILFSLSKLHTYTDFEEFFTIIQKYDTNIFDSIDEIFYYHIIKINTIEFLLRQNLRDSIIQKINLFDITNPFFKFIEIILQDDNLYENLLFLIIDYMDIDTENCFN